MRTNSRQLAIVAFSFGLSDLLTTGPIDSIRWTALCRGKRRLSRVRAWGRAVQSVVNRVGLALWTVFAAVRDSIRAGFGYVGGKVSAGYCLSHAGAVSVHQAVTGRVNRVAARVFQVFAVLAMYAKLYTLFVGTRISREKVLAGWSPVPTSLPETEKLAPVAVTEPSLLIYQDETRVG
jgi:hypothetical protein